MYSQYKSENVGSVGLVGIVRKRPTKISGWLSLVPMDVNRATFWFDKASEIINICVTM